MVARLPVVRGPDRDGHVETKKPAFIPKSWELPESIRKRLGDAAGRQRLMDEDGHLLFILHQPPEPEDDEVRKPVLVWGQPNGEWKSSPEGGGLAALDAHMESYRKSIHALDEAVEAAKTPRQYYKPKVLKDFELTTGRDVSFEAFANEKGQTADTKRYLMIAAWCHDHAATPEITADHVWTCYRAMGWTLDAKNPKQPLADIQRQGWGEYKKGSFEINHIGIGVVAKMKPGE